jgi:hypothetical protein
MEFLVRPLNDSLFRVPARKKIQQGAPQLFDFRRMRLNLHPVRKWRGARRHGSPESFDLHNTEAAAAVCSQAVIVAQGGDLNSLRAQSCKDRKGLVEFVWRSVDSYSKHF